MVATLSPNAETILKKRYLNNGESINNLFKRVSLGNPVFEKLMTDLKFLPNSPTLFNAGLNNGCTLSACFVFNVADSMFGKNSIVETREKAIAVAKAGGGVGYSFSNLRPKGSPISTIHRVACGPVTVMKDYQAISRMITQGGKRDLAQMGVLRCDHPDIEEFIDCKNEDPQSMNSFNISVAWTDTYLSRVSFDSKQDDPKNNKETKLWWKHCKSAWKTGCPGILFIDTVNKFNANKHLGLIEATNPCGETPNRNNEPCNLGSMSLPRYVKNDKFNFTEFSNDVGIAIGFLDNILDINLFPHKDIDKSAKLTRKLGLGVMGWADTLALLGIQYDSNQALNLAQEIMKCIEVSGYAKSEELGRIKGYYPGFSSSQTDHLPRRNETVTSIAPTGTISIIAGVWGGIEPYFSLRCERTTNEGIKMQDGIQDWVWERLNGLKPKIASEISPEWHIKHQAIFQRFTDLGVSKTVNLPKNATIEDVSNSYKMMWKLGCKGGTIFRDGCRDDQVLVKKETKSVYYIKDNTIDSSNKIEPVNKQIKSKLPNERRADIIKLKISGVEFYLTIGFYPDGKVGEIFINGSFGSTMTGLLNSFSILFSVALQNGVSLAELIRHHKNTRFEPYGQTDCKEIPVCTSITDFIARYLEIKYLKSSNSNNSSDGNIRSMDSSVTNHFLESSKKEESGSNSGIFCPDCGSETIYKSGCLTCPILSCGWTRCG